MADRVAVEAGVGPGGMTHTIQIDSANVMEHAKVQGDLARCLDDLNRHGAETSEPERKTTSDRIRLLLANFGLLLPLRVALGVRGCQFWRGWHAWRHARWCTARTGFATGRPRGRPC